MAAPVILDRWGRPIERGQLRMEIATPTVGSVRSPISSYPADGLDPMRLATILRQADQGDAVRYLELAETIEERDPHYLGVLGTRRRAVSQIDVTVEAASDDPADVARADMVREWLKRDELTDELFDILDCIGKGFSFTEIIWDTSEGQWQPARLEWRDPRWFRFARTDLTTPMIVNDGGQEEPLAAGKFIFSTIKAKSGLALRSGLARVASWGWMFKAYTSRDWAIFTQTYGQPLRLGKYPGNATEEEKETLFRAVANIAGDCAAIVSDSMTIDFIESKSIGASSDLYKVRADWLDQQISKAVLGQTATTDAIAGGHAVGREHRQVQKDIETADAKALSAILNRDLIRVWMQLEFGPLPRYPRLKIARPEEIDLVQHSQALASLIPLGLRVEASEVRDRFGYSEPKPGAEVLGAPTTPPVDQTSPLNGVSAVFKRGTPLPGGTTALQADGASTALLSPAAHPDLIARRLEAEAAPHMGRMLSQVEAMLAAAGSLEEFREMLMAAFPDLDASGLASTLAVALTAADLAGRVDVENAGG